MRMIALSLVSGVCLLAATSANAEGVALTDHQLDQVTAGALELGVSQLTMGTMSASRSFVASPLLRQAVNGSPAQPDENPPVPAQPGLLEIISGAYSDQNNGQEISKAPVLGKLFLSLQVFGQTPSAP